MPRTSEFVGRYRWLICLLLFFGTSINYIDRQILSLLKPILDDQLHWTNEEYGRFLAANPEVAKPSEWGNRSFNQARQPVVG